MGKDINIQELKDEILYLISLIDKIEDVDIKQVDVDLLRLKVAGIYEKIMHLNIKEDVTIKEPKINETNSEEIKCETDAKVKQKSQADDEIEMEINFDEHKNADKSDYKSHVELVQEKPFDINKKKTIGESFSNKKTIHDLVNEVAKEDVNFKYLKVDNLNKAISINDKIEFVRELFGNNAEKYDLIIRKLNEQNDLDSAIFVLSDLNFDNENPAAKKLINLVYRKFLNE